MNEKGPTNPIQIVKGDHCAYFVIEDELATLSKNQVAIYEKLLEIERLLSAKEGE